MKFDIFVDHFAVSQSLQPS